MNNSIDISNDQAKDIISFLARRLGYNQIKLMPAYGGSYWYLSFRKRHDATYVYVVYNNYMQVLKFGKRPTYKLALKTMISFAQYGHEIKGYVSKQQDMLRQSVAIIKPYQTLEQVLVQYDLKEGCIA